MTHPTRRQALIGLAAAPLALKSVRGQAGPSFDVAVIGAGVFGAWTAWHLAKSGQRVALVEAYAPGHRRSSSGGESRVTRLAYGPDRIYSEMAQESLAAWQAISERSSNTILHRTGVLWFSQARDAYIESSIAALTALGTPPEILDGAELGRRFPQVNFDGIEIGFLEHGSGALMARRGVRAVADEAIAAGVTVVNDRAARPEPEGSGVRIPLGSGGALTAGQAVYACGPWFPKVFPEIIGARIRPTRQEVFYFAVDTANTRFRPPNFPVWADFNDGNIFYGFPAIETLGFKIANDAHGGLFDPDTGNRRPTREGEAEVRAYMARRFPDLANARLADARVCQYENTANGDFLIDRHPDMANVWLVGGGSGHGFKHGPAVGRTVAELVTGEKSDPDPRFSLASKGTVPDRSVH